jgi:hypothetical protein
VEQAEPAGGSGLLNGTHPFPPAFVWTAVAIISAMLGEEVISLISALSDHTTTREALEGWRFSTLQEQWLYDEVDLLNDHRGPFVHGAPQCGTSALWRTVALYGLFGHSSHASGRRQKQTESLPNCQDLRTTDPMKMDGTMRTSRRQTSDSSASFDINDRGGVVMWDVDLESWKRRAGQLAKRRFTQEEWREYSPETPNRATFPDLSVPPEETPEQTASPTVSLPSATA